MKQKILLSIIFIMTIFAGTLNVSASDIIKLKECEYTDEYIKYLKLDEAERKKTLIPQMCKINYYNKASMQFKNTLGDSNASSFDLRKVNKLTPIKNQEDTGFCWTFAASASIESNALVRGLGEYDLSETHIELSNQNTFKLNYNSYNRAFNSGGNSFMSASYVMNHRGPVLEQDVPFSIGRELVRSNATSYDTSNITNKKAIIDVNDVNIITGENKNCSKDSDFTTNVKRYLVNHGAMVASMYFDDLTGYTNDNGKNILISNSMIGPYYYYSGNSLSNHEIAIVGWDDSISKENFKEGNRPSSDGAWIIKNSYGTSNIYSTNEGELEILSGDDGYYYVSYEDNNICNYAAGFYNTDSDVDDNTYYYDELGYNEALQSHYNIYAGTTFNKKTTKNEQLSKVSFFAALSGVGYTVYYDSTGTLSNPVEIATGTVDHLGYVTVYPNKDIIIDNNKYSIIVKYNTTNIDGEEISILPTMAKTTNSDDFYSTAQITSGVNFISIDMKNWADITKNYDMSTTIRAYTKTLSENTPSVTTTTNNNNKDDNSNSEVNDNATVEVAPNENNSESYISTPNNPRTSDFSINTILITIILLILLVILGIYKLRKIKKYN